MTTMRRSQRERKQVQSIYNEAAPLASDVSRESMGSDSHLSSSSSSRTPSARYSIRNLKRKKVETESEAAASDEEPFSENDDEDDDDSSSEDEEPTSKRRKTPPKKAVPLRSRNTRVNVKAAGDKATKFASATGMTTTEPSKRAVQTALQRLARKIVPEEERGSLLGQLLYASAAAAAATRTTTKKSAHGGATLYTAVLEPVARHVVEKHAMDANAAQVELLNLLFRSVGGSKTSQLDASVDLENMGDDEWALVCTNLVDDMQNTAVEAVCLSAQPPNAGTKKASTLVASEYAAIYGEFWFLLGKVALEMGETRESERPSTERFAIELCRDLIIRLVDLVGVGQPDLRRVATLAIYHLAAAMLEQTVEWQSKLDVAVRQHKAAERDKSKRKAQALMEKIDGWKRSLVDLETIVTETVIHAVFSHRYRDSNYCIRKDSLEALSRFAKIRPDLFMVGRFLKYFGWMLSDKDATVRMAAVSGLLAPFTHSDVDPKLDMSNMRPVIEKFGSRLASCAIDVDVRVQEKALELLLVLSRRNLLDTLDDDGAWEQINLRALAPDTTPLVRRDALAFVIEQLEAFDSGSSSSDAKTVERINAISSWIAHILSDSRIPVEHLRLELTDLVVASLRALPDHKSLTCDWSAFLRALQGDGKRSSSGKKQGAGHRDETVQKLVLLRMLVASVKAEVASIKSDIFLPIDADLAEARAAKTGSDVILSKKDRKSRGSLSHEELTITILRALPDLLASFKTDAAVLQSLTSLPQYFLPTAYNLPNVKKSFEKSLAKLSEVFLDSTDTIVMQNCGLVLAALAQGKHARSGEALLKLKKLVQSLCKRLFVLCKKKSELLLASQTNGEETDKEPTLLYDTECSLQLTLRRLCMMSKRWHLAELLNGDSEETNGGKIIQNICASIVEICAKDLKVRQVTVGEDSNEIEIPQIWKHVSDANSHRVVAKTISVALDFLLCVTAWMFSREVARIDDFGPEYESDSQQMVVSMRDTLVKLAILCFEQYVEPKKNRTEFTTAHVEFAEAAQTCAGRLVGDLRGLFPKQLAESECAFLRSCSLTDDSFLAGGFFRFLRLQEHKLRNSDAADADGGIKATRELLLPFARGLCPNWRQGNRREAGILLSHIMGSGEEAAKLVSDLSRSMKRMEPVRFLEAHMASLRGAFEKWLDSEPEDLTLSHPSEEELAAFEEADKAHREMLVVIELQAQRLSSSLGVGKLGKTLDSSVLGFIREGVRFAFSTSEPDLEEDLPIGAQLPFLRPLSKYFSWIRRDQTALHDLRIFFSHNETELRNHPQFAEIREEELEHLSNFRKAGDLGEYTMKDEEASAIDSKSYDEGGNGEDELPSDSETVDTSLRRRLSGMSSVSSIRSKASSVHSFSPIAEEENTNTKDDEDTATIPAPPRQRQSHGTSRASSKLAPSQDTIEEEGEKSSDDEVSSPLSNPRRRTSRSTRLAHRSLKSNDTSSG